MDPCGGMKKAVQVEAPLLPKGYGSIVGSRVSVRMRIGYGNPTPLLENLMYRTGGFSST
jgi:hypothetical protein